MYGTLGPKDVETVRVPDLLFHLVTDLGILELSILPSIQSSLKPGLSSRRLQKESTMKRRKERSLTVIRILL